ncbi:MAG: hypothetical protein Q4F07_06475 [Bacteroidales bacterium]|nr:hypothetical protein [Bacteroidales bacterium]
MKFIKSIIPALVAVLAVGFTACSDDDDYTAGAKSPGAYFAANLPKAVTETPDKNSFDVPVQRTAATDPASYEVSVDDPSGLFTVPSTVVFDGESLSTKLTISYDASKVETDKAYPLTLTLKNASTYGNSVYSFTFTKALPMVRKKAGPEGLGTYTYNGLFGGDDPGLTVYYEYNENNPNYRIYYVENWGGGTTFQIIMPDASKINSDGTITVYVPVQDTYATNKDGDAVWVADYYHFWVDTQGKTPEEMAPALDWSYYNPETGLFSLSNCWYIPGTTSWYGNNYEFLQLNGFPDYSVDATYSGIFTDPKGAASAVATVTSGADVNKVKTALVQAADEDAAIEAVEKEEVDGIQELKGGSTDNVLYPVSEDGVYYIVVVSYDGKGVAQNGLAVPVKIQLGKSDWAEWGQGVMCDSWVIPGYKLTNGAGNPVTNEDLIFAVNLGKSTQEAGVYALLDPYGEGFPLTASGFNSNTNATNVQFTIEGDFISFEPQYSGYTDDDWGDLEIGNTEGMLVANNPGASVAAIQAYMAQKGWEATYIDEDGFLIIPESLFGAPGIGDGSFGYSWKKSKTTIIMLPGAPASAVAKMKAKAVAKPAIKGLSHTMANKAIGADRHQKQLNPFAILRTVKLK